MNIKRLLLSLTLFALLMALSGLGSGSVAKATLPPTTVQLDFSAAFNADVVENTGDTVEGTFDGFARMITQSVANAHVATPKGLNDNGVYPANSDHPEIILAATNDNDGFNAWKVVGTPSQNLSVNPSDQYAEIHILVSAGGSNPSTPAKFTVTLNYSDGSSTTTSEITVPDWFGTVSAPGYYLIDGMDRYNQSTGSYEDSATNPDGDAAIFGFPLQTNPAKTLTSIDINITDNSAGSFVFFGGIATQDATLASPPVAGDDSYSTNENSPLSVSAPGVLANDSDANGDSLTTSLNSNASNGTVSLNSDGSFTYTPNTNFSGTDSFTYTVSDGSLTDTGQVTITVNSTNSAPVATDDSYSTDEDTPLIVAAPGVLANDSDADGDSLTASLDSDASNGTVSLNSDGSFTYTPDANFNGQDSFTYIVSDGSLTDSGQVTITVNAVNDAPVAQDDSESTDEDNPLTVAAPGVLANDSDLDGDSLSVTLDSDASNGTVSLNSDGSFTYTPDANFNGTDSFTYIVSDGSLTDSGEVTITVNAVNDAPVAQDDSDSTDEDNPLTVAAPGVLANDSDVDGDSLSVTLDSNASNGTVSLNSDGSFTYTPDANFNGQDSFTYTVSDGSLTDTGQVTITVNAVNDAPVASDDSESTDEDNPLTVAAPGVLANDSDVDGDSLSVTLDSDASNGTVSLNSDGSFTYTPDANFNGQDSFTYTLSDGSLTDSGEVTITVNSVNDAPVATDDSYTTDENSPLTVAAPGVLANDSDVDGDSLSVTLDSDVANGTLSLSADGSFVYTPTQDFNGQDGFTLIVSDGSLTDSASVLISIPGVTVSPSSVNVTEGGAIDSYQVVLSTQPTDSVTIEVMPDSQTSVSPSTLTFTTDNWDEAQTVTVTAVDDNIAEGNHSGTINHSATSNDSYYDGLAVDPVSVNLTDNDSAGVSISPSSVSVTEGGATEGYQVVLTSQPIVTVTVSVNADSQTSVSSSTLTFTSDNWDEAQTVTVSAIDDEIAEGNHLGTINHSATSDDSNYDGLAVDVVTANITDNDSAGISVSPSSVSVTEGGAIDSYQVVLTSQPTATVTIEVSADSQTSVSPNTLTFTSDNWDEAQTVTVTAVDDDIAEGNHLGTINHSAVSDDSNYDGLTVDAVSVNITDNDSAGVSISPSSVSVTEGGATEGYQVVLTSQPTATVTVAISPDTQTSVTPTTLTFTTDNWDEAQTVTVSAIDDEIAEGNHLGTINHSATSDDSNYDGLAVDVVTANITDNDSAGISVSPSSVSVTEGGATDSYQVVLTSQPTATVTVEVMPDNQSSVSPTTLTFTTDNWDEAQTVTVSAVDDDEVEGAHIGTINHSATSDDNNYDGLTVDAVTVNISDNDEIEVEFELEQLELTIELNGQMSQTLSLNNTGNVSFDWEAFTEEALPGEECSTDNNQSVSWLTINPTNGTILPGETQSTLMTVDATGLEAGDYYANICIWISQVDMMTTIPVSLSIVEVTSVEVSSLNTSQQSNMPPLGLLAGMLLLVAGGYVALKKENLGVRE